MNKLIDAIIEGGGVFLWMCLIAAAVAVAWNYLT